MSLASYVRFMFDNVEGGMLYPYEQIAKYWMELLQEKVWLRSTSPKALAFLC